MAGSLIAAVGAPPDPLTSAFLPWTEDIISQFDEAAPDDYATTYFIDPEGDDSAAGTRAAPWATITKGLDALIAGNGDMRIRLKRGGVWREFVERQIASKDRIKIDSYGSGPNPLWSAWVTQYPIGHGWTDDGDGTWSTFISQEVGWIRSADSPMDHEVLFRRVDNAGQVVSATDRAWHWSGNRLKIRAEVPPSTLRLEAVPRHAASGVISSALLFLNCDDVVFADVVIDGLGMRSGDSGKYPVQFVSERSDYPRWLVTDCKIRWGGYHNLGFIAGATAGANFAAMAINVEADYNHRSSTGTTNFVSYAEHGGQEAVFKSCKVRYGQLPTASGVVRGNSSGIAFHTHAGSNPTSPAGLHLVVDPVVVSGAQGVSRDMSHSNMPGEVDWISTSAGRRSIRAFYIREQLDCWTHLAEQSKPSTLQLGKCCRIDSTQLLGSRGSGRISFNVGEAGFPCLWIGGTIDIDFALATDNDASAYTANVEGLFNVFLGTRIVGRNVPAGLSFVWNNGNRFGTRPGREIMVNGLFAKVSGAGNFNMGMGASNSTGAADRFRNIAFYNVPLTDTIDDPNNFYGSGRGGVANAIILDGMPDLDERSKPGDGLFGAGVGSSALALIDADYEYQRFGLPVGPDGPSIGWWDAEESEGLVPASVTTFDAFGNPIQTFGAFG